MNWVTETLNIQKNCFSFVFYISHSIGVVRSKFRHEPGITKLVLVSKSGLSNSFGIILFQIETAL